ncbi:MAG TPA: hypothetical protein VI895_08010 [Bdellovibrionota bacterium]|nr:hypothetical protein [Bdellovibrionota bacterium]
MERFIRVAVIFLLSSGVALAQDPMKRRPRGRAFEIADWGGDGICRAGITGEDVWIQADPRNDLINAPSEAIFYYTPSMFFQRVPSDEAPFTEVDDTSGRPFAEVRFFLLRDDEKVLECLKQTMERKYGQTFHGDQFIPLPGRAFNVRLLKPELLDFQINYYYPPLDPEDETDDILLGDVIPVSLSVPKKNLSEFLYYLELGIDFNIRYGYATRETSQNRLSGTSLVEVSAEAERKFFGERQKVYATKDQVARLFLDSRIEQNYQVLIQDSRVAQNLLDLVDRFLQQHSQTAVKLADLANGYLTTYGLNLEDDFFKIDFTSTDSRQTVSVRENLTAQSNFWQEYSRRSGGGGFSFFGIKIGGGGSGDSGNSGGNKSVRKVMEESGSSVLKEGRFSGVLNATLYEINRANLQQFMKTQLDVTVQGDTNIRVLSFVRNSVRHSWIWRPER